MKKTNKNQLENTPQRQFFTVLVLALFSFGQVGYAADTQAPTPPTEVMASVISANQIIIRWQPAADNVGVLGYKIYRDNSSTPLALETGTSFSDSKLVGATTYSYRVSAIDAAGNESARTASIFATTAAAFEKTYTLTVIRGSGGGSYVEGKSVIIKADAAILGKKFDHWVGSGIKDIAMPTTMLTMPGQDMTVSAVYVSEIPDQEAAENLSYRQKLGFAPFTNIFNPKKGTLKIRYTDGGNDAVQLQIYDRRGNNVQDLRNPRRVDGFYEVDWDGRIEGGDFVPAGVYLIKLFGNGESVSTNAVVLK